MLAKDECLECELRKAGEAARGLFRVDAERRDSNLRSKGRWRPVGLEREPGLSKEGSSLRGEDRGEPCDF